MVSKRRLSLSMILSGALSFGMLLGAIAGGDTPAAAVPQPGAPAYDTVQADISGAVVQTASKEKLQVTKPKLRGTTRAGSVLKVKVSRTGKVKPALRFDWLRNGKRIGGASGKSYKLKKKDIGKRISVRVTATKTGYAPVVKTSKKTAKIKPKAINDATSIHVVVNKQRPLKPKSYVPKSLRMPKGIPNANGQPLRKNAASALERMAKAARKDGIELRITSGYRSYDYQASLYNAYVARDGRALADTYSARPGHSEHQTGLAVDLDDGMGCGLSTCFAGTTAGKWLKKHAHKYGFILRYPSGYTHITGYMYEPWHYRYVGKTTSKAMKKGKIRTLEEYRGLKAAPDYS